MTQSVALPTPEAEKAAVATPPAPKELDVRKSPMSMNTWLRLGGTGQNYNEPKKINRFSGDAELDILLSGQIIEMVGLTANLVANFGNVTPQGTITGDVNVMDLIAKFDFDDAFHFWAGRMLVPSDRSNFSGPWFIAPWKYPGFFKPFSPPIGPRQGPNGRNDGATIWGQAGGGLFKYYAGMYDLWDSNARPLLSGRLSLSLLNPEPGYYGSSTFYGKDLLGLAIGAQFQKAAAGGATDYGEINADLLFEKELNGSGVIDVEGAFYKYFGDVNDYSYFALISYLTPMKIGPGALQPLVRLQQNRPTDGDKSWTLVDAQLGYVIDTYACRIALGYQYQNVDSVKGNQIFLGVQLQK